MSDGYPKNFRPSEFHCNCGGAYCDGSPPDPAATRHLAWTLQLIRDFVHVPLKINSGFRCEKYNEKVGGSTGSKHKLGIAADLNARGIQPKKLHAAIEELVKAGKIPPGGLGLYSSFVHYDIRPGRARWTG